MRLACPANRAVGAWQERHLPPRKDARKGGMMRWISVILFAFGFTEASFAQPNPDTLWTRTYGGGGYECANSVQQTADGGYVVAGGTESFGAGGRDVYLVRTSSQGDTLWTRTYGGTGDDYAFSVQQTADGGYIVAGSTYSFGAARGDFYLVKTDSLGDTLWTRAYGESYNDEWAYCVQQTAEGGYIVAGYICFFDATSCDFYLVKTNSQGDTLWTRIHGGRDYDEARSIQQTADGGYIVAGTTQSFGMGSWDFYLVKTDSQGDTLWTRTFGGSREDWAQSVQQTADGGYVVAGFTWTFTVNYHDFFLVKTDDEGNGLWTRTFGGRGQDWAYSVQQTADGGYVVAGTTESFGAGGRDVYLVRTSSQGDTLWTRTYGGIGDDWGNSVQQTADGGYIVVGLTAPVGADSCDVYIVKTGPEVSGTELNTIGVPSQYILSPAFPNPFNPTTQTSFALPKAGEVSLRIFNLLGQEVVTLVHGMRSAGMHAVTFDGSTLPSGIYFYRLQAGNFVQTQKMLLLK